MYAVRPYVHEEFLSGRFFQDILSICITVKIMLTISNID